ncbi:uncharacterized protein K452DRAFT_314694 [Aplosporella prunicola CBS 121167]|uniref:Transcriptional coactivator p15 (PC4) C-terminal domain-containing protein n=1 Tax=Aplosporella prunicola CBS 121167 TaxID=1176127 RepID=A0A6A6BU10_9PEZI|nr:uncharacterized protein K452DRAFT_314694 [Aplosporella prunicola CBS 121167]KAF2147576.1 hypothetical protein K452DRAFT_314694 [Aplosporella prunicola CBS 121167]
MPPKRAAAAAGRKRASEVYEDDGFVVGDEGAPQLKRAKGGAKKEVKTGLQRDDEGNEFWEISNQRRVTVSQFKGKTFVSVREYYEKDGKAMPGKKGISLSVEQYSTLLTLLPDIEAVLGQKGESVPRPSYEGEVGGAVKQQPAEDEEGEAEEEGKKNFEATSDEGEE